MRTIWALAWVALGAGCFDDDKEDTADAGGTPTWMEHPCGNGDPVERTCAEGVEEVELDDPDTTSCAELRVSAGEACDGSVDSCELLPATACADDPLTPINSATLMYCRTDAFDTGPCPQSTRRVKREIRYMDGADRAALSRDVLGLRLARYRYLPGASPDRGEQLGFIIEDSPDVAFVSGDRVNLYAYTSALVATVQAQEARIRQLEGRLESLEAAGKDHPGLRDGVPDR